MFLPCHDHVVIVIDIFHSWPVAIILTSAMSVLDVNVIDER